MQLEMFEGARATALLDRPVNVASVPHRSPFRYPGGKTWLVPRVRNWLRSFSHKANHFIEPFAGGGIISLTVAAEKLADHVTMVELDDQVAAVWKTIIQNDGGSWLGDKIMAFDISRYTSDDIRTLVEEESTSLREQAFKTILKNRTYHGGILAPGSAPVKSGENGKGLYSRWYPETLRKRILGIVQLRDSITFVHSDGLSVMEKNIDESSTVFFIDPPYTASGKSAGNRLYRFSELDHERLFEITSKVKGDFLMTYDNAPEVREMASGYGFETKLIAMKNTHNAEMTELLIGRDLRWIE